MKPEFSLAALKAFVERIDGNSYHTKSIRSELERLTRGAQALHDLAVHADPTVTPAAHAKKLGLAAARFQNEVPALRDKIQQLVRSGLVDIEARIAEKVPLRQTAYSAELRQVFRGLPEAEQAKLLNGFVESGDFSSLAAITEVPAILSGVSPDVVASYKATINQKHAGAELAEQQAVLDALDATLNASDVARELAEGFNNPELLASIANGEQAASDALQAFNANVSGV